MSSPFETVTVRGVRYVHNLEGEAMNWLPHFLRQKGMTASDLARASGQHRQTVSKQMAKPVLHPDWAEKFAPFLGVSPQELLFGPRQPVTNVRLVPIRGEVAASRWVEMDELEDTRYESVPVIPGRYANVAQFGFKVVGNSMDRAGIADGAYVICVPYFEARAKISDGDRVVVERRRGQLIERTCKQIVVIETGYELWPRSTDARFQSPLIVLSTDGPKADDGTEIEIIGLVIGVFVPMDG